MKLFSYLITQYEISAVAYSRKVSERESTISPITRRRSGVANTTPRQAKEQFPRLPFRTSNNNNLFKAAKQDKL